MGCEDTEVDGEKAGELKKDEFGEVDPNLKYRGGMVGRNYLHVWMGQVKLLQEDIAEESDGSEMEQEQGDKEQVQLGSGMSALFTVAVDGASPRDPDVVRSTPVGLSLLD